MPLVSQQGVTLGGTQAELAAFQAHIVYQGPLRAPIAKGAVVAKLVVEGPNGNREFPLTAGEKVGGANWFAQAFEGLRRTVFGAH